MIEIGKWLFYAGCSIALFGGLIWFGSKLGIPLGHIPGDINISREKYSIYFPIVTCLIISVVLTILLNLLISLFRK